MDLILGFALVLVLSLIFAGVIILLGRSVAPKARTTGAAVESYACGEPAFEGGKIQFNLPLFNYALYFLFFESLGFILFLSWQSSGLIVITYLLVTLVAAMYVSLTPKEMGQEAV